MTIKPLKSQYCADATAWRIVQRGRDGELNYNSPYVYEGYTNLAQAKRQAQWLEANGVRECIVEEYPVIQTTHYYDARDETMHEINYTLSRSMAGYVSGPEYRVSYKLLNGQWLNGLRHKDRGDLMTSIEITGRPWVR